MDNLSESKKLIKKLGNVDTAAKRLIADYGLDPSLKPQLAQQLRRGVVHGGMASRVERYAEKKDKPVDAGGSGKASLGATLLTVASKPQYTGASYSAPAEKGSKEPKTKKSSKNKKVMTVIPPNAVRLSTKPVKSSSSKEATLFDMNEGCGCKSTLGKKIKEKYLKEVAANPFSLTGPNKTNVYTFENINFNKYMGKKVLAETVDGTYYGTLGTFKNNLAVFKNGEVQRTFEPNSLLKFVCEDAKLCYKFTTDEFLQEKKVHRGGKILVTNKAGTKVLGTHTTEAAADAQLDAIHASQARRGKLHESSELLLKEQIKNKWFVKEEVVNPANEFTMTNAEIQARDKRAEAMLRSGKFNPKLKNGDTKEEAAHRIATFMIMSQRSGKGYEGGLFGREDERSEKKYSRRQTRDLRRLTRGDKAEDKYEKRVRPGRKREKTATKGTSKERRTFANVGGTEGERFTKASEKRNKQTVERSRYARKN
jgi:hypothetical protein